MQTLEVNRWRAAILISSVLLLAGFNAASGSNQHQDKLTEAEENAIRATIAAYRTAWLANDAKGVLKTFTDEAVLLPAHGAPAVTGIAAIEKYWFAPGGPLATLTELNVTVDEVSGNQTLAYARGLDSVAWTMTQAGTTRHHSHPGTYLNVMRKQPDGSWRIQVHMWDDGPERVE